MAVRASSQVTLNLVRPRSLSPLHGGEPTKSSLGNGLIDRLGHNMPFSVDLDLYVKPKLPKGLGKKTGFCVFNTEMAARAGIEPATK